MKGMSVSLAVFTPAILLMLGSCDVPVDRGVYNPKGTPPDKLVMLRIAPNLTISTVDKYPVYWTRPDNNYSQVVKMSPGIHLFEVSYNDGATRTLQPISAIAKFETGNVYTISNSLDEGVISIHIWTKKNGVAENALFNTNSFSDNDGPFAVFIKTVYHPTLMNTDGKVLLSGDNEDILFESDLVYRKTDKTTGKQTEGRYAIEMDFTMGGRVYFLETDIAALSSEDFLSGDFRQTSQMIASPVSCDEETVTFLFSMPEEAAGSEAVYTITDLTPVAGEANGGMD